MTHKFNHDHNARAVSAAIALAAVSMLAACTSGPALSPEARTVTLQRTAHGGPHISASLFESSYTIASAIANEFTEATQDLYLSALVELGLILFFVTFVVNAVARILVWNVTRKTSGVGSAA